MKQNQLSCNEFKNGSINLNSFEDILNVLKAIVAFNRKHVVKTIENCQRSSLFFFNQKCIWFSHKTMTIACELERVGCWE